MTLILDPISYRKPKKKLTKDTEIKELKAKLWKAKKRFIKFEKDITNVIKKALKEL